MQVESSLKTALVFTTKGAGDPDGTLPEQAAVQAVKQIISRREMSLEACLIRPRWFTSFFQILVCFVCFLVCFRGDFTTKGTKYRKGVGGQTAWRFILPAGCGRA